MGLSSWLQDEIVPILAGDARQAMCD